MTIDQIREIADQRSYVITASLKEEIIAEFLEQQNGE